MSHFNQVANEWDSPGKVKLMGVLAQKVKEKLELNNDLNIFDFGCGTGLFGLEFMDYAKTLTGLDTSEGMIEVFKKKIDQDSRFDLHVGELDQLPAEKKFDLIVSSMVFHHVDHPKEILQGLTEHLNPGGKIAIVDLEKEDGSFHPDPKGMGVKHFGFTPEEIQSWNPANQMHLEIKTINEMDKEGKTFNQFLAVFSR